MNPRELAAFFEQPEREAAPKRVDPGDRQVIDHMTYDVRLLHAILVVLLAIEAHIIGGSTEGPPDSFERTMPAPSPDNSDAT